MRIKSSIMRFFPPYPPLSKATAEACGREVRSRAVNQCFGRAEYSKIELVIFRILLKISTITE